MVKMITRGYLRSKAQIILWLRGIILGAGVIIPGVSGGTIMVIFGMYEKMLQDLLRFHVKPYIAMGIGVLVGVFAGGALLSFLFDHHPDPTYAFILGCLLMSIPLILKRTRGYTKKRLLLLVTGGILSFSLLELPTLFIGTELTLGQTFLAGFVSSATMMVPGVSGSALLIVLGLYEEILEAVRDFQMGTLIIFVTGAATGVFILAKVLKTLFTLYMSEILFFFTGLIIGSFNMVMPGTIGFFPLVTFGLGLALVYRFGK
ncbi:DUF368 domain-containing protein [Isachenkonia alkalipeptolytica]|uniref:DUF368 domain-containing protein n=2 Tax=Isachenkonia alkalipeptolytica TaxID=2565777 RepID=A0AA43XKM3_9CLOT|nr:DUF368 domain-containing protein [Isachenkonia alkalipeptolytica]